MEIAGIAYLGTHIEMRKEVLKYALDNEMIEEDVWLLVDCYRKEQALKGSSRTPAKVSDILLTVHDRLDPTKITNSPMEDLLQTELAVRNLCPERGYKIGKLTVDFCFPKDNLVIEVDGKDYHSSPEQKERDERRDGLLMKRGYTVLRFPGRQIYHDPKSCVARIAKFLGVQNKSPP